jgi:hypothetical protein
MSRPIVLLTVDWEPDHRSPLGNQSQISYSGITEGTAYLERVLDDLEIPCTWFIETSMEVDRSTTDIFPDIIERIRSRRHDEIGLHSHWRRFRNRRLTYDLTDVHWVNEQILHGVAQLDKFFVKPRCFRSGALLSVKSLPILLSNNGFHADSSTLWGLSNSLEERTNKVRRGSWGRKLKLFTKGFSELTCTPYFTDDDSVESKGCSNLLELPIHTNILTQSSPLYSMWNRLLFMRMLRSSKTHYVTLFFHIDELIPSKTGAHFQSKPGFSDPVAFLHGCLLHLKEDMHCSFLTVSRARSSFPTNGKQDGLIE